jgi:DNA segregation ATPase FtsK/SpoIIIE-like protein
LLSDLGYEVNDDETYVRRLMLELAFTAIEEPEKAFSRMQVFLESNFYPKYYELVLEELDRYKQLKVIYENILRASNVENNFEKAARLIVQHQQGSVSLLQTQLKIGYSLAASIIDELESAGILGPFDGSTAREVLVKNDDELDNILKHRK